MDCDLFKIKFRKCERKVNNKVGLKLMAALANDIENHCDMYTE